MWLRPARHAKRNSTPQRGGRGIFCFAAAHAPEQIDEAYYDSRIDGNAEEGVRESAMMGEGERRTSDSAQDVEIGGFGGERQRQCGERGLAIESGAPHAGAGQEVSDGFQGLVGFYLAGLGNASEGD
jgi:hypothetical protein